MYYFISQILTVLQTSQPINLTSCEKILIQLIVFFIRNFLKIIVYYLIVNFTFRFRVTQ